MKQYINLNQFMDVFVAMDRDQYSYEAYTIIYEDLETLYCDEYELDVIAVCCEYAEYTEEELTNDYGVDKTFKNMNEELQDRVVGWTDKTVILRVC